MGSDRIGSDQISISDFDLVFSNGLQYQRSGCQLECNPLFANNASVVIYMCSHFLRLASEENYLQFRLIRMEKCLLFFTQCQVEHLTNSSSSSHPSPNIVIIELSHYHPIVLVLLFRIFSLSALGPTRRVHLNRVRVCAWLFLKHPNLTVASTIRRKYLLMADCEDDWRNLTRISDSPRNDHELCEAPLKSNLYNWMDQTRRRYF